MQEENKFPVPKWLTELQHRSWEPEILLSGIVLYGMFKVPDLLDTNLAYFKLNIFGDSQDIDNLVSLFKMGIYSLITGLILHLICRGIWIGMVGLSYTFPNGIRTEKLNYESKFKEKVERTPSYELIVVRLEKICSSLFSVSFMLFMSLIGGYMYFFVLIIAPFFIGYIYLELGFEGPLFDAFQVYVLVILGIGMIALGDFLTMGYFRKYKWFAKIYWPIHKVISMLTLSRFYRPIYYGMVTNFNKWAFFVILGIFITVNIMGTSNYNASLYPGDSLSQLELWGNTSGTSVFSGYYQDQNTDLPSVRGNIPSDIISGNVLKLFVVAKVNAEDNMLEHTPLDSLREVYPDKSGSALKLMVVQSYYTVFIDEKKIEDVKWFFHYNTHTEQRGYLTYLDISDLEVGSHNVDLRGHEGNPNSVLMVIPFYRDMTFDPSTLGRESEEE